MIPRFGPTSGGNLVTILGQHFGTREQAPPEQANPAIPSSTAYRVRRRVSLGGAECVSTVLVSDSEILCVAPTGIGGGAAMVELLDDDASRLPLTRLHKTEDDGHPWPPMKDRGVWGVADSFSTLTSLEPPVVGYHVTPNPRPCSVTSNPLCDNTTGVYQETRSKENATETDEAYTVVVPAFNKGEAVMHRWRRAGALPSELAYNQLTLMLGGVVVPASATVRAQGFVALSPSPAFPGTPSAPAASAQRADLYVSRGVSALAFLDGKLFAGGSFLDAHREHGGGVRGASWLSQSSHFRQSPGVVNVSLGGVLSFDGHQVSSLGLGLDGEVLALAIFDGKLIAGGSFTIAHHSSAGVVASASTDSQQALHTGAIAQWDEALKTWSRLPGLPVSGLPGVVHAIAAGAAHLFVGGALEMNHHLAAVPPPVGQLNEPQIRGVAVYDAASGRWSALGTGVQNGFVYSLLLAPLDIWGDEASTDTSSSMPHQAPAAPHQGEDLLFVGGDFRMAGGHKAQGIAMWHMQEQRWHPLGQLDGAVYALAAMDGWLYAGGDFTMAGGSRDGSAVASDHVVRFRHGKWHSLVGGVGGPVYSLASVSACLYVGGRFDRVCVSEDHWQELVDQGVLPPGTRRNARCKDEGEPALFVPAVNAARFCPFASHSHNSTATPFSRHNSTTGHSNAATPFSGHQWEPLEQASDFQIGTVRAMSIVPEPAR